MIDAQESSARRATAAILFAFAFQCVWFTGLFPPFWNPNELSRFQAVVSMAEWKTLSIDRAIAALGDHEDKAVSAGRFYSNKAPGLAFAAYPAYRLLRLLFPAPTPASAGPLLWALRLLTVSLVSVLALRRLASRLRPASGSHPGAAPLVTFAVAFGTPYLFYARTFFAHAWSAALLFLAWDRLRASEESGARRGAAAAGLAGLLAGGAVISEYTVAPIALVLAVRALARPDKRRLAAFALGAAVPLAILLAYNAACFGSPFTLSSAREADPAYAALAERGIFGLGAPSARVARELLLGPTRGVLLFSPFLLWSLGGALRWWRSGKDRADCAFVLGATGLFALALTGYPNWHGGWSLGSRYLLPAVLLAALPAGRALETALSRGLFVAATVFAVGAHALLTSTFAHLSPDQAWPAATDLGMVSRPRLGGAEPRHGLRPRRCRGARRCRAAVALLAFALVVRAARPVQPAIPVAVLARRGSASRAAPAAAGALLRGAALARGRPRRILGPGLRRGRSCARRRSRPRRRSNSAGRWECGGPTDRHRRRRHRVPESRRRGSRRRPTARPSGRPGGSRSASGRSAGSAGAARSRGPARFRRGPSKS